MAYIQKTAFEVYVSNSKRNDTQNITGKFGSFSGGTADANFTPDVCSAGFLCTQAALLPNEGYESAITRGSSTPWEAATGLRNGNSWYMIAAASGKVTGATGDHTGIYASNTYDVAKGTIGNLTVNIPGKTLGLPIPAGERGDFTELIVGEQYNFGEGNFSTKPTSSLLYCTIANGLLVAQAAAPTDGSVYFQVLKLDGRFTEGAFDAGEKYTLKCLRSTVAA